MQINAPINGIVTERDLHPRALVGPSGAGAAQPIVRIKEVARLSLVVALPERYFASLKLGLQVAFKVSAYPQERFVGVIRRPAYSVDKKNRAELVELDVQNTGLRLSPGMFVETQWPIASSRKTFVVPDTVDCFQLGRRLCGTPQNGQHYSARRYSGRLYRQISSRDFLVIFMTAIN